MTQLAEKTETPALGPATASSAVPAQGAVSTTAPVAGSPAPAGEPVGRAGMLNQVAYSAFALLAVLLFVFVAEMAILGPIKHVRAQDKLYDDFRRQLAEATAPTGQVGADGKAVPLGAPVAMMRIRDLGIKEVVAEGTTSGVLADGPGHLRSTPLPGQAGTVVIFGRQAAYGGPFDDIDKLRPGAEIAMVTGQGTALYKVTTIRHPGDLQQPQTSDTTRLTLVTGDGAPFAPSGVVQVDAELATPVQPSSARPITTVSNAERAMKGDRGALLGLLLWSELLLVLAVGLAWVRAVWGRWQSWIVSVPVLGFVGFQVAGLAAQLLPNLM